MPYIDPAVVEQVKQIDLLSYLSEYEPDELVKLTPSSYCTRSHDSLKISNGKWFWWSRGFGGKSALDYLIKVRGMSFLDAAGHLAEQGAAPAPRSAKTSTVPPRQKDFLLPPKHDNSDRAIAYLESRGIAPGVIKECVKRGLIYETRRKGFANVIFVGVDNEGLARCASVRGCKGRFKGEIAASDKRYPFAWRSRSAEAHLHVFESAIDALSYATLLAEQGFDWRNRNLLSVDGIPPVKKCGEVSVPLAISQYLADNPATADIHLHLDSDEAGFAAAYAICNALYNSHTVHISPPPEGKDWNEYLMMCKLNRSLNQAVLNELRIESPSRKLTTKERRPAI